MKPINNVCDHSLMYLIKCVSKLIAVVSLVSLMGCDPGQPDGSTEGLQVSGSAAALSQSEFNSLSPEKQYQVASKLLGTFYRGITADEFYDLSAGMENLQTANKNFLIDIKNKLSSDLGQKTIDEFDKAIDGLDDDLKNPDEDLARYTFDTSSDLERNQRPRQIPLARIKDYPISRDLYVNWMAYFLANTVMYSPAEEMESTDMLDVQRMFRFLHSNIADSASISQMVRSNLGSLARWRVARTPQNHALEAFENYLGLFQDENLTEVEEEKLPLILSLADSIEDAGIACRDLFLTRASDDYLIGQTDLPNTTPKLILENSFVTNCTDVYDVVAGHNLLVPRAIEVISNYFFPGQGLKEKRLAVQRAIIEAGPQTYEEIFTAIIFSREYLLNTQRPKSFEENFLPLLDTLKWDVKANVSPLGKDIFERMSSNPNSSIYLGGMSWNTMALKIGRFPNVPLDALSFANYHKAMRESLLTQSAHYQGGFNGAGAGLIFDENGDLLNSIEELSMDEYIDYLFLNVLHRKATSAEQTALYDYFVNVRNYTNTVSLSEGNDEVIKAGSYNELAEETFDYISRLPELYYFNSVGQ